MLRQCSGLKTLGRHHPVTQHHIPQERGPQESECCIFLLVYICEFQNCIFPLLSLMLGCFLQDIGAGKGKYYAVNIPLRDGMDDESYESIFVPIISKVMETFQPSAVVLQCGADSLTGDRLGCFNLTVRGRSQDMTGNVVIWQGCPKVNLQGVYLGVIFR